MTGSSVTPPTQSSPSSSGSSPALDEAYSFFPTHSVYIFLVTLELASIGIKYQGLNTNPFQESSVSKLLFIVAIFCHPIALIAKRSWPTALVFHVSGVIACETLLWILVMELRWCFIINVLLLLTVALCFYHKDICELFGNLLAQFTFLNADQMTDLEAQQEDTGAQMQDL